jgi:protein arginine N-methyltransferase 1
VSLIVDEHREYLSDDARLAAFARALAHYVTPESIVADLGAGTGILGLLACQAGAARVYAIEAGGMVEVARALAAANGLSDRLIVVKGHISDTSLPERAGVLVGDFIGRFGFEAGLFETYPAAARALLAPGGVLIPAALSLYVFPVESIEMDARVRFWLTPRRGVTVAPAFEWAVNTGYPVRIDTADLLGGCARLVSADTSVVPAGGFAADVRLGIERAGTLHGLGGGFEAGLAPGVTMSNLPGASPRVAKRNVFLPIRTPVAVQPGDAVRVRIRIVPNERIVAWTVEIAGADGRVRARCAHSTLRGMLLSREDLSRARPDFVPELTRRGAARLSVLELCDGTRRLRDVERAVFERHRDLFESPDEAAVFVAEVTSAYARP